MSPNVAALTAETFRALTPARRALGNADAAILRTQLEVARIAAPTGAEARRAAWMRDRFARLGFAAQVDAAGNVVARRSGAAPAPVVVCAHLDTVFPSEQSLEPRREGPRWSAPGISDNGRGLAALLALADVLRGDEWRAVSHAIEYVATTGEEGRGDLRGAKHYFGSRETPFAVLALDGAGDERIVNTALGSRRFHVGFRGPGGHSWAAADAPNPIHAAARLATALGNLRLPGGGPSALTVSRIGGGVAINAVPEDAWLEVDARSTSDAALARLEHEVRRIAAVAAREETERRPRGRATPITHVVERIGDRAGGELSESAPLVQAALEATRLVGRAPELATASTDANAAIAVGAPAIAIGGGGRGGDAHTTREWYENVDATAGVARALTIAATMARLGGRD